MELIQRSRWYTLYGKYKGTLMIAMVIDANSQLLPLTFVVVEGESNDTWSWFLDCIRHYVTKRDGLCVISNHYNRIFHAINRVLKRLGRAICISSMKIRKYNFYINCLKEHNEDAYKYLVDGSIPERQWTLIHDGGHRYGVKTTNMSEAFNGVMKRERCLLITSLVRMTFFRVNEYFATRRDLGINRLENGHVIYDTVRGTFEVTTGRGNRIASKGGKCYMVYLTTTSCSCQKPTMFKLPCLQVLAVCRAHMFTCDPWNGPIVVLDPSTKRGKGRPRSTRIRNEMDAPLTRPRDTHELSCLGGLHYPVGYSSVLPDEYVTLGGG
ncbi:uncharacterized protein LOC130813584 [Amaranthus tricolor]|uniref:uncharacterized protein LOC130813584 n=1 Tax=Amaranthus tricolor TaxID=29722 RepID=UPI002589E935|nr:uncharacterized protein LOC130813584 [Amaranthus tricolor]